MSKLLKEKSKTFNKLCQEGTSDIGIFYVATLDHDLHDAAHQQTSLSSLICRSSDHMLLMISILIYLRLPT